MDRSSHEHSQNPHEDTTEGINIRSIVLELPPAPAALVLVGLAFATLSALSAAAFLLIAVLGPPGGDRFRPLLTPADACGEVGEDGRGEDYRKVSHDFCQQLDDLIEDIGAWGRRVNGI